MPILKNPVLEGMQMGTESINNILKTQAEARMQARALANQYRQNASSLLAAAYQSRDPAMVKDASSRAEAYQNWATRMEHGAGGYTDDNGYWHSNSNIFNRDWKDQYWANQEGLRRMKRGIPRGEWTGNTSRILTDPLNNNYLTEKGVATGTGFTNNMEDALDSFYGVKGSGDAAVPVNPKFYPDGFVPSGEVVNLDPSTASSRQTYDWFMQAEAARKQQEANKAAAAQNNTQRNP